MTPTSHNDGYTGRSLIWQAAAIFLLALGVRLLGASSNPVHVDELYHLLAGRSWAEDGSFRMLDGEYLRGRGFTALVGLTFELFGRADLYIARLPSVLAGALLAGAIFYWLSRQSSLRAGWIGALLFCFASYAIVNTQFTRFYALQALLVWLGAIAVYRALAPAACQRTVWLLLGALVAFAIAAHLQITTVIAVIALAVWAMVDLSAQSRVRQWFARIWADKHWRAALLLGLLLVAGVAVALSGSLLHQFRFTPRWAAPDQNNYLYYFLEFFFTMPIVWLFLPLAAVVALVRWPRPALFCIVMTVIPLMLQSAGGMKSSRYVFYAFPFLFALWGMASAVLLPLLWKAIQAAVEALQLVLAARFPQVVAQGLCAGVMLVIVTGAVIANPMYRDTIKSLRRDAVAAMHNPSQLVASPPDPPWTVHQAALRIAIGHPAVLLVGDDFNTITYLGDFDLLINTHRVADIPPGGEFVLDPRTGRRAISTPQNITRVIACYPDGAIVVSDSRWRTYIGVSDAAADTIEQAAQPLTPAIPGFHIYMWRGHKMAEGCGEVRALATGHRT